MVNAIVETRNPTRRKLRLDQALRPGSLTSGRDEDYLFFLVTTDLGATDFRAFDSTAWRALRATFASEGLTPTDRAISLAEAFADKRIFPVRKGCAR